jgi:hypothetical protein
MSVSKKTRFEIFKRDGFRCVYCGKQPPDVTLELEHITPKSKGGADRWDNYCTSCFSCNRGKSDIPLSEQPPNSFERLAFIQEKLENLLALKRQSKLARKLEKQENEIKQKIVNYWCQKFEEETVPKQIVTMMFNRLLWIDIVTMESLIDICAKKMICQSDSKRCRYMAGILRSHLASIGIDYNAEVQK